MISEMIYEYLMLQIFSKNKKFYIIFSHFEMIFFMKNKNIILFNDLLAKIRVRHGIVIKKVFPQYFLFIFIQKCRRDYSNHSWYYTYTEMWHSLSIYFGVVVQVSPIVIFLVRWPYLTYVVILLFMNKILSSLGFLRKSFIENLTDGITWLLGSHYLHWYNPFSRAISTFFFSMTDVAAK